MSLHQLKISVLIAAYNAADNLLRESIQSIIDQRYVDFELIVVNDGSEDSSGFHCLEKFNDSRIKLIQISHRGLAGALNAGIHEAKGEYLARMDADDVALPARFAEQINFLEQNPQIDVVGTSYEVLASNGSKSKPHVPICKTDLEIKNALPKFNPIFHGSVMMRKKAVLTVGGYDESFSLAQDYDLWLRMSRKFRFSNLEQVLMLRREDAKTLEKESRQNWYGIKAKVKAIHDGNLKLWHVIYLIRPLLVAVIPIFLKQWIRKVLLRHGQN